MAENQILPIKVTKLASHFDLSTLSCDDPDLDDFLQKDAIRLQNKNLTQVYLAYYDSMVVGYVALLCDNILLLHEEKEGVGLKDNEPRAIPALKIGRLAASKTHREQIRGIGTALMQFSYYRVLQMADVAGCRLLSVDAYPQSVGFYTKLGFVPNLHASYQGRNRPTVSMRFDAFHKDLPNWTLKNF